MNESRPQLFGRLAGLFLAAGLVLSAGEKTITAIATATCRLK